MLSFGSMRVSQSSGALSARAIVGTRVVLFGMNLPEDAIDGLLGFAIERTELPDGQPRFLDNFIRFAANDDPANPDHSSRNNPFQHFYWGDYTPKPGTQYRYRVIPLYGAPNALEERDPVELDVTTQSETAGTHSIFFNRGAATSQAYAKAHNDPRPDDDPTGDAFRFLSRGLAEGLLAFIAQATGPGLGLRCAFYEFHWGPVLDALREAGERGADVKIVFDAVDNSKPATDKHPAVEAFPRKVNLDAIAAAHLPEGMTIPRTNKAPSDFAHNKFMVLLRDGVPEQVWTGSTNISEGGLYGQSNVGHLVRDGDVAASFLAYWNQLAQDPARDDLRAFDVANTPVPDDLGLPPEGAVVTVFSPRPTRGVPDALGWYAKRMGESKGAVFLTEAFSLAEQLKEVFLEPQPYLRYLLLDKIDSRGRPTIDLINRDPDNQVTPGAFIGSGGWRQWVEEKLTGLDGHVHFIHTKYMLIDPLGDDPIVISGSANFSDHSTTGNDENMLVIRGDKDVADDYVGEFMRLFTHYQFRAKTNTPDDQASPGPHEAETGPSPADRLVLKETDEWARRFYVDGSPEQKERELFSGAAAAAPVP
jgi:phosphatidylserine/phosphatidylglycerophosphate/cardiolipin synthase-like enzyme